jgi:hypothetical protein
MVKKALALLAIIPILLLPSGCWDRREIEDLLLVGAIIFGKSNVSDTEQYRVSFITTKPSSSGGEQVGMSEEGGCCAGSDAVGGK